MKILRDLRFLCLAEVAICSLMLGVWLVWSHTEYWAHNEGGPDGVSIMVAAIALLFWIIALLAHLVNRRVVRVFWIIASIVACLFALEQFMGLLGELRPVNHYMEKMLSLGESSAEDVGVALICLWMGGCGLSFGLAISPLILHPGKGFNKPSAANPAMKPPLHSGSERRGIAEPGQSV